MEFHQKILWATLILVIIAGCCCLLLFIGNKSAMISQSIEGSEQPVFADEIVRAATSPTPQHQEKRSGSARQDAAVANRLEEMMRRDFSGLEITKDSSGMQTMNLNDRFTHVSAAFRDEHGVLRIQCFSGYPAMQESMAGNRSTVAPNESHESVAF